MQPTNELRFVKRVIEPGDHARRGLILQQKWSGSVAVENRIGGIIYTQCEEWRDVPVEEE